MIKKLFTRQINSITLAALLVALSSLFSRILGVLRDRILASEFGLGDTLDVYYAAFRIPDLVFNLLVLGALSAGFVPILTKLLNKTDSKKALRFKDNNEAWAFVNTILNILGIVLIALGVIGFFIAPWLMKLIVPGFSADKMELVVELSRIMFISPVLLGISSVFGGVLQAFKRFFVYSLSPILYNIGIIIGAIYFVPMENSFGGINGLAWGVVLGALLHMIIGIWMTFSLGFHYKIIMDYKNKEIKKLFTLMLPRTLSLATTQLNLLAITALASSLAAGSLAVFNFANNLQSFPIGIFGISFAVAAFPALSVNAFNRKKLIISFSSVFRQIIFFIMPATVLFLTLRAQIVRLLLGAGLFGWNETILTIDVLSYFLVSLFAQATIPLLVRVYYARQNTLKPFTLGLISVALNILFSFLFINSMGVAGLALAFSLANIINFLLLWLFIHFELGSLDEKNILRSIFKIAIASLVCGVVVQISERVVSLFVDMDRFWEVLLHAFISGGLGISAYLGACYMLNSEEFMDFWIAVKRRFPLKKTTTGDHGEARGI